MGQIGQAPQQTKQDEKKMLAQAQQFATQLGLYSNDFQKKQQKYLFARIMIYGHRHLLSQFKQFSNYHKKKKYLQELFATDYQTIDLLYQNIICKQLMNNKNQKQYQEFTQFQKMHDKKSKEFRDEQTKGQNILNNGKVGLLIFAGGSSSRFINQNGQVLRKELYKEKPSQKSLLQITLEKAQLFCQKYNRLKVYIVHNEQNKHYLENFLSTTFKKLNISKIIQTSRPIINLSGKLCLKEEKGYQIIEAPSGCGDFLSFSLRQKKLLEVLLEEGIEFLSCIGTENIFEKVIDPSFLGKLVSSKLGGLYKCTYPQNLNENLPRIVFDSSMNKIVIDELQNLEQTCKQSSKLKIRRSPVWMNSVCFNVPKLIESLQFAKKRARVNNELINFTPKKIKATYWNPVDQVTSENQYCFVFERELSDILINGDMKIVGVMVDREEEYMPVISLQQENIWKEAYRSFQQATKKKEMSHLQTSTLEFKSITTKIFLDEEEEAIS